MTEPSNRLALTAAAISATAAGTIVHTTLDTPGTLLYAAVLLTGLNTAHHLHDHPTNTEADA